MTEDPGIDSRRLLLHEAGGAANLFHRFAFQA
jgi:hypothetical protein